MKRAPTGDADNLVIPGHPKVPRNKEAVERLCALIMKIHTKNGFKVGVRGWGYLLEPHGLRKGDLGKMTAFISRCRKSGHLPVDLCDEDEARGTVGLQELNNPDVADEAKSWVDHLRNHAHENYLPISFWDDHDVYVEATVEKDDLVNLFETTCAASYVPITNMKGWSDINSRAAMMRRFKKHAGKGKGRKCILLIFTDHDPSGMQIREKARKCLTDLSEVVGWFPTDDELKVVRIGLNADFIDANKLPWIHNLQTSGNREADADYKTKAGKTVKAPQYVLDYIRDMEKRYGKGKGKRKCEANALIVEPVMGRKLMRDAILKYVKPAAIKRYQSKLKIEREKLRVAIQKAMKEE